jgi:hypothetical protein
MHAPLCSCLEEKPTLCFLSWLHHVLHHLQRALG